LPTFRYCQFCEIEHIFRICLDRETDTFELWCSKSGLRVETVTQEDDFDRFLQLTRQFIPPPSIEDPDEDDHNEWPREIHATEEDI